MAHLVEQSLPIPEVRGSNPVIDNKLYSTCTLNCIEETKIKVKEAGNGHYLKITFNTIDLPHFSDRSIEDRAPGTNVDVVISSGVQRQRRESVTLGPAP